MKDIITYGTLSDVFIYCCKLYNLDEKIRVYHYCPNSLYNQEIKKLYSIVPNLSEIRIFNKPHEEIINYNIPLIYPYPKKFENEPPFIKMNYFPKYNFDSEYNYDFSYIAILAHPWQIRNQNYLELTPSFIQKLVKRTDHEVVLIGFLKKYENIKDCHNLIGKISVYDAISIIQKSKYFIGSLGLMAFIALSNKIRANLLISNKKDQILYLKDTPWDAYCKIKNFNEDYLLGYDANVFELKKLVSSVYSKFLEINFIEFIFEKILKEKILSKISTLRMDNRRNIDKSYKKITSKKYPRFSLIDLFIIDLIPKDLEKKIILNVGCGEGRLDFHLKDLGFIVYSTDVKKHQNWEDENGEYGSVKFYISNIYNINSFPLEKAPIVICSEVLEHLRDYKKALRNLLKLTEQILIITVPFEISYNVPYPPPRGHCNFWSDKKKLILFKDINEFKTFFHPYKVSISKLRAKPSDIGSKYYTYVILVDKRKKNS